MMMHVATLRRCTRNLPVMTGDFQVATNKFLFPQQYSHKNDDDDDDDGDDFFFSVLFCFR
jgi:hypothetical protein